MFNSQKTHQDKKSAGKKSAAHPAPGSHKSVDRGQLLAAPLSLGNADLLNAQGELGNGVVQRALDGTVQREGEGYKSLGGGSANKVFQEKRDGQVTGYLKPDIAGAYDDGLTGAKNAVVSSAADQVLGTNVLSKEEFKRVSGAKLPGLDPAQTYSSSLSTAVKGTPVKKSLFTQLLDPIADSQKISLWKQGLTEASDIKEVDGQHYGQTGYEMPRHDYRNPRTQKDLADIHTLDAITGQQDRHGGNIIIDDETGSARGIDNDYLEKSSIQAATPEFANLRKASSPEPEKQNALELLLMSKSAKEAALAPWNAWNKERNEARKKAIATVEHRSSDKSQGLPSHMDGATVQKLLKTKSIDFLLGIQALDPENISRISQPRVDDLRNRYSAVRRYAKAGAAQNAPHLLTAKQLKKYGSPEYQAVVRGGTGGVVPTIVDKWDDQSYNRQLDAPEGKATNGSGARSYLARTVKRFNQSFAGGDLIPEHYDMLPSKPLDPAPKPQESNPRHARLIKPSELHAAFGQFQQQGEATGAPLINTPFIQPSTEPDHRRSEVVNHAGELPPQVSAAIQKQRGGGVGLPGPVQTEAKQILGHDFSNVRIHAGAEANRLSRSIQAKAFTIGKDIFFKQGLYTPGSKAGRETLLHELTHVVQQAGSNSSGPLRLGAADTMHEKQAEQISKSSPTSAAPSASQAGTVQRSYLDEKLAALGGKAKTLARRGKKWGLGKAKSLGKEYLNHFIS